MSVDAIQRERLLRIIDLDHEDSCKALKRQFELEIREKERERDMKRKLVVDKYERKAALEAKMSKYYESKMGIEKSRASSPAQA